MRRKSEEERIVEWFRSADLLVVEVLLRVLQQLVRERQIDAGRLDGPPQRKVRETEPQRDHLGILSTPTGPTSA